MSDDLPGGPPGPAGPVAPPTCYRHPDRETYIRCGRCDRPICPECMTSAAVGFQCPECLAEGRASVREGKTVVGGTVRGRLVVTPILIGLCLAAYVAQLLVPGFTDRFALFGLAVADGEWWRLITAGFLHGGLLHLAFNMYALYWLGSELEPTLGRGRFLALYLGSLVFASSVSYAFAPTPASASVGASGAIFGLFGAAIVMSRRLGVSIQPLVGLLVVNAAIAFFVPSIDWRAHVGGLVAGLVMAAVYAYTPPRLWTAAAIVAPLAALVLAGVLTAQHTADLRNDPRYAGVLESGSP